jgi:toxin ParE1/3/4
MNRYRLSRTATSDLRAIWAYVAKDRPAAADGLIDTLYQKFRLAATNPGIGESREDLSPGLRVFSVGSYVVGFRKVPQGVEIVRVVHGARDQRRLF